MKKKYTKDNVIWKEHFERIHNKYSSLLDRAEFSEQTNLKTRVENEQQTDKKAYKNGFFEIQNLIKKSVFKYSQ